jgi:Rrf2 family protein
VDYGVRLMTLVAQVARDDGGRPVPRHELAERGDFPAGFLVDILTQLRNGRLLRSRRGGDGGWTLARPADTITIADVIRALEGPLASVRGVRPHELADHGGEEPFISMWIAVRASLRAVLETVTVADLAAGTLPAQVQQIVDDPDAWDPHRSE